MRPDGARRRIIHPRVENPRVISRASPPLVSSSRHRPSDASFVSPSSSSRVHPLATRDDRAIHSLIRVDRDRDRIASSNARAFARTVVRFVALATHRRVGTERFIVVVVGIVRRTTRAPWCDDESA